MSTAPAVTAAANTYHTQKGIEELFLTSVTSIAGEGDADGGAGEAVVTSVGEGTEEEVWSEYAFILLIEL
jgi:hypothetical protein